MGTWLLWEVRSGSKYLEKGEQREEEEQRSQVGVWGEGRRLFLAMTVSQ